MSAVLDFEDDAIGTPDAGSLRLVDMLLEEQRSLRAVDEFSAVHESLEHDATRYETLIPTDAPGGGQQYAFRVDLDGCTGCKACVTACHSLNGLEPEEAWRRVGVVEGVSLDVGSPRTSTHQQTVTTACHHCEDPACLAGCPVRAYDKDATTGIVRHLDDQCIGCRYCQLMCPYDVPTYSERLGIVRKCDLCHERLAVGEAPACVQGCPNEAISIDVVESAGSGLERTHSRSLLPVVSGAMPNSRLTLPTTRYVSSRSKVDGLEPVDLVEPKPNASHTPLAVMLVLTQVAIGVFCIDALLSMSFVVGGGNPFSSPLAVSLATGIGLAGLAASVLHLGRPQWAFRAVLGLRTSWMSREIIVLGGFAGLLVASCALGWIEWGIDSHGLASSWRTVLFAKPYAVGLTIVFGLLGLYCSIQIYAVTGRPLWRFDRTARRFLSTAAWTGVAVAHLSSILVERAEGAGISPGVIQVALLVLLIGATFGRLRMESGRLLVADSVEEGVALERSRRLLTRELAGASRLRRRLLVVAGIGLPAVQLGMIAVGTRLGGSFAIEIAIACSIIVLGIASDLVERSLFFRSEAMPSMPGLA